MKKIMISIIAIGCLLSTTLLNASGQELIKTNVDDNITETQTLHLYDGDTHSETTISYNKKLRMDESYTYHKSYLNATTSSNQFESSTSGVVDLAVTKLKAWYSPHPTNNSLKYYCVVYECANIGDAYSSDIRVWVNESLYVVYNNEESRELFCTTKVGDIPHGILTTLCMFCCISNDVYFDEIQVEIVTTALDSDLTNNIKEVELGEGVTIWGRIYTQNLFGGNKQLVNDSHLFIDSDCDGDGPTGLGHHGKWGFGTEQVIMGSYVHDWFTQVAPKNPDKPKYEYSLTATISLLQWQTKHTEPLTGMDYRQMFFTFLKIDGQSIPHSNPQTQPSTQPSTQSSSQNNVQQIFLKFNQILQNMLKTTSR